MKLYVIRSNFNCNRLAELWACGEADALAAFHQEMAPVVLDVYAVEVEG